MNTTIVGLLASAIAVESAALPAAQQISTRQDENSYSLPQFDGDRELRIAGLEEKRQGWAYGPSIAGNTSFYPTGTLGEAAIEADNDAAFAFRE